MIPGNGDENISARQISFPNFEISCAVGDPARTGYWFGSDDGRIQFMSLDEAQRRGPLAIAPSEEAVSGIAIGGDLMAVSTRSDVTFLRTPQLHQGHPARTVFIGGAHGLTTTHGGRIIAPMGRRGILLMDPKPESAQRVRILRPADETLYVYKIVSLTSPNRATILACACRLGGLVTMPPDGARQQNYSRKLQPVGVDFVDVAALDADKFPFAVAALGLDCSIHFVSDLLGDQLTKTLHLSSISERAYRILCAEGHVFVLTDKSLYAFEDLATRFLRGEPINDPRARQLSLNAVDASLGPDRSLLVVMPDSVYRFQIDAILGISDSLTTDLRNGWRSDPGTQLLPTEPDNESWKKSEELELMEVR
jgi:hypothetical protein